MRCKQNALGAALVQEGKVIAYASRVQNDTEERYSQIEKGLKAMKFSCKKFHTYIYAKWVTVDTVHKPLEVILKATLTAP